MQKIEWRKKMIRRYFVYAILISVALLGCKRNTSEGEIFLKGAKIDFATIMNTEPEEIKIGDFYISSHMVTRAEYEKFVEETSYEGYSSDNPERSLSSVMPFPDCPAMFVSFYDACSYCNYLSSKNNLEEVYELRNLPDIKINENANGYRLPSKDEWFYAFLGGNKAIKTRWWENMKISEYINDSFGVYAPVGNLRPNPAGLYDMLGNGLEWTGTEVRKKEFSENEKQAFVIGTGVPGNSIQDFSDCTDFLRFCYDEETAANISDKFFYIGFRTARNSK